MNRDRSVPTPVQTGAWTLLSITEPQLVGSSNSDIKNGKIKKGAPSAQLYDLEADVNQTTNVYNQYPEVVQQMAAELKAYQSPQK